MDRETEQIVQSAAAPAFFAKQLTIRDASSGLPIPFSFWPAQARLLDAITKNPRLAVLHGEGVGTTTTAVVFALWFAIFHKGATVRIIGKGKGETLVKQVRHALYRLPPHLRLRTEQEGHHELVLSTGSRVIDFDPGHDVPLLIADGEGFAEADRSGAGRVVVLSRPGSAAFDRLYQSGGYRRHFVPYSARPGRAGQGVETEAEALGHSSAVEIPSFREFVEWAWPYTPEVSQFAFKGGLPVDAICHHLQLVADGKIKKLAIQCPVRHGKSVLVSVLYPVWSWLRNPRTRIITATYGQDLTVKDADRSRDLIAHPAFEERFGKVLLLSDANTKQSHYHTSAGGYRFSASIGSRTSGYDADLVLCDDLHKVPSHITSQSERQHAIDYFWMALAARLVPTGSEAIVLAGHRVHEDDIYKTLGSEWVNLVLPVEADPVYTQGFNTPHWSDPRRPGEILWPEHFGATRIAESKAEFRHYFSPVFNQKPVPPAGHLFNPAWFKTWTEQGDSYRLGEKTYKKSGFTRVITVDLAISTKETADWTVAQVWDLGHGQMVLAHQHRERVDGARVIPLLQSLYKTWQPQFIAVESVGYQQSVIDQLRDRNLPTKRMNAVKDKQARSVPAQVRAEAGQVWIPQGKDFTGDFLAEVGAFPNGRWDDQVDTLSMAAELADRWAGTPADEEPAAPVQDQKAAWVNEMLWADTPFG